MQALVIDDEPLIGRALTLLLGDRFDVVAVQSVDEARRWIAGSREPDVVICDLSMPTEPGTSLWSWLERERPSLLARLVWMSGDLETPDAVAVLRRTGARAIEKPFTSSQLVRVVGAVTEVEQVPVGDA